MKELISSKAAGLWLTKFLTKWPCLTGTINVRNTSLWLPLEIWSSQIKVKKRNLKKNRKKLISKDINKLDNNNSRKQPVLHLQTAQWYLFTNCGNLYQENTFWNPLYKKHIMVNYFPKALFWLSHLKHTNQSFCVYHIIFCLLTKANDSKSTSFG